MRKVQNPGENDYKGNVRVVSHRGNAWKNDMSLEDIKRLYEYALSASSR